MRHRLAHRLVLLGSVGWPLLGSRFLLQLADLRDSNLKSADLRFANLEGAGLGLADMQWAKLIGTNLKGADILGALLHGANLELAKGLTQAQLDQACGNEETKLPNGLTVKGCPGWGE